MVGARRRSPRVIILEIAAVYGQARTRSTMEEVSSHVSMVSSDRCHEARQDRSRS
jgi:hypothetical protein